MTKASDLLKEALKNGFALSKFLDSAELTEIKKIKNNEVTTYYYGGYEDAERVRAIIVDKKSESPTFDEFAIVALKIVLDTPNLIINHRHVLGTLMSLGIKRETIGDIIISSDNKNEIIIFISQEMENFIKSNLIKINNNFVTISKIELNEIVINNTEEIKLINVASLRLDAVIARTLNLSRNKAVEMIEKNLVQINHLETDNTSYILKENDLISIRHFGRIKMLEVVHTTKKDRLIIKISVKH